MSFEYESARKEYMRTSIDIPVRYKFLSKAVELEDAQIFEGTTARIATSGFLLVGKIPSMSWIPGLLTGKILIGVNILLPSAAVAVKALTRVAWVEAIPEGSERCALGLSFKEITKENQDELLKFMIRSQLTRQ
jgi:c-di-GMP-binding flagellar brake protein YcgR